MNLGLPTQIQVLLKLNLGLTREESLSLLSSILFSSAWISNSRSNGDSSWRKGSEYDCFVKLSTTLEQKRPLQQYQSQASTMTSFPSTLLSDDIQEVHKYQTLFQWWVDLVVGGFAKSMEIWVEKLKAMYKDLWKKKMLAYMMPSWCLPTSSRKDLSNLWGVVRFWFQENIMVFGVCSVLVEPVRVSSLLQRWARWSQMKDWRRGKIARLRGVVQHYARDIALKKARETSWSMSHSWSSGYQYTF